MAIHLHVAILAFAAVTLLYELVVFWGTSPDFADRFIIPLASLFLVHSEWESWKRLPVRPRPSASLLVLIGMLAFPPAWFLMIQVGPRSIVLWWLLTALLVMLSGVILVHYGWHRLRAVAFPMIFLYFALPLPNRIEVRLQPILQEIATTIGVAGLSWSALPVERYGFQIHLPHGNLEVVDACSGIRSLTALTAIAAITAHMLSFGLIRGLVLLVLSLPIIAFCNGVRIWLTGLIQEYIDPKWIHGTAHDVLGFAMVLIGLVMILLLARLLRGGAPPAKVVVNASDLPAEISGRAGASSRWALSGMLTFGLVLTVTAVIWGDSITARRVDMVPLSQLPMEIDGWKAEDLPIDPEVTQKLTYDYAVYRVYRNPIGQEVYAWVIFWQATSAVRGYHHPDICWPRGGWETVRKGTVPLQVDETTQIPITIREFHRNRDHQRILYWTQEGSRVWNEEDENRTHEAGPSHNWIRDRLLDFRPRQSARIAVLIGSQKWGSGDYSEKMTERIARYIAHDLYTLCPWSKPDAK